MKRLFICIILLIICICWFLYQAVLYYAPPQSRSNLIISIPKSDTLAIAFIGDSWAELHNKHNCLIPVILDNANCIPVKIRSYGISRRTSKELYYDLFDNEKLTNLFHNNHFDYCIIAIGVNDTDNKLSTNYYKKSMDCIIRFMLERRICPIILEIPDYYIQKTFTTQGRIRTLLRRFSMFINNIPIDCKQEFRNTLNELIQEKGYEKDIIVVRYKSWHTNYSTDHKNLYMEDGLHLNVKGYAVLDSVIAKEIIKREKYFTNSY